MRVQIKTTPLRVTVILPFEPWYVRSGQTERTLKGVMVAHGLSEDDARMAVFTGLSLHRVWFWTRGRVSATQLLPDITVALETCYREACIRYEQLRPEIERTKALLLRIHST